MAIIMEAIADRKMQCMSENYERLYRLKREEDIFKFISKGHIVAMSFEYWKSELKYSHFENCSLNVILILQEDYYRHKNFLDLFKWEPNIKIITCERYGLKEIFDIYFENKNKDLYIIGDTRLFWAGMNFADKIVLTTVDYVNPSTNHNITHYFPEIEKEIWKETNGTIIDEKSVIVEYSRINTKGMED